MTFFMWFVIPTVWMLLAAVTGLIAEQRGYDFHEYYWMALLLPGISLALLYRRPSEPLPVATPHTPSCSNCREPLLNAELICTICGAAVADGGPSL